MNKILIFLSIIAILLAGVLGGWIWYDNKLSQSKKEGEKIVSRAIPDSLWTNNKITSTLVSQTVINSQVDMSQIPCFQKTANGVENFWPESYKSVDKSKDLLGTPAEIMPVLECGQSIPKVQIISEKLIKSGHFVSLDPAHYAKGAVNIIESGGNIKVAFSDDFATNPDGPDLYVWLVPKQEIKSIALGGVKSNEGDYLDLGPLQSKFGSQAYQVTKAELAANDYAVVIWCRAFGIQFSNAILK
jgi:Electron transfer DM13